MLHKILVPLDGSRLAEKALPYAESLAEKYESELLLLWVFQPNIVLAGFGDAVSVPMNTVIVQEQEMKQAEDYLNDLKSQYQIKNIPTRAMILKHQDVAEAIIELADKEAVDVIVKTTHGRSGPPRWVFGNVALKVLQGASCPVFLVRIDAKEQTPVKA